MSEVLNKLIHEFQFLPGVGEKTAQRFVHHIFGRDQIKARKFGNTLLNALDTIQRCTQCQNLTDVPLCSLCTDHTRDRQAVCIVEHPANVHTIESTQTFKGLYFVLHGVISPIDGVGPQDLGISILANIITKHQIKEIIIATSTRIEGEATAYYLYDQFSQKTHITRIAHGIPIGDSLEYTNSQTLSRALLDRKPIELEYCE